MFSNCRFDSSFACCGIMVICSQFFQERWTLSCTSSLVLATIIMISQLLLFDNLLSEKRAQLLGLVYLTSFSSRRSALGVTSKRLTMPFLNSALNVISSA